MFNNSEIRSWLSCPVKHTLEHRLGRVPNHASKPLEFGTAWHAALESLYADWSVLNALEAAHAASDYKSSDFWSTLESMLEAYAAYYADDLSSIDVIALEQELQADIFHHTFRGKFDGIIKVKDTGKLFLFEHKTTRTSIRAGSGGGESAYFKKREQDGQTQLYIHMARENGYDLVGVVYNVSRVPEYRGPNRVERIKKALADDPESFFQRRTYCWSEVEIGKTLIDIATVADLISMDGAPCPRNLDKCVSAAGFECEYYNVCHRGADINDPMLFRDKKDHYHTLTLEDKDGSKA